MRRYKLKVGLDVDDTLYDCNSYALKMLKRDYPDSPDYNVNDIKLWGKIGSLVDERVKFFSDPEFVRTQPIFPGAQKFVKELNRIADVFFVTAVPPECMSARAQRLAQDFPEIPTSNIIIGTRKDIYSLDVLLDDGAHNISSSQASYPVLFRRPWNTELFGLLSVNTYDDFLHLIKMIRSSFMEKAPDLSSGGVICLVGPSGSRKTELADALTSGDGFVKPRTTTTRPRRAGENTDAYYFTDEKSFIAERDAGKFIETTVYSGYYYGASTDQLDPIINAGKVAVIPIDICGALSIKNVYKSRAMIVFTERSREAVVKDIICREADDNDKVRRIMALDFEYRNAELCDIAAKTDDIESAVAYIKRKMSPSKK